MRLSLDVRMQYALETELDAAARASHATGGAAILLDGRTGETLALASWPTFNPNQIRRSSEDARRDRVAGDLHELGSTIKPFTVAMALQEEADDVRRVVRSSANRSNSTTPSSKITSRSRLRDVARYSRAFVQCRRRAVGASARWRAAALLSGTLGLTSPTTLQLGRRQAPLAPAREGAAMSPGLALATASRRRRRRSPAPTRCSRTTAHALRRRCLALAPDAEIERTQIFTPEVTRQVMVYLRAVVTDGTGRAANVPGLLVAGKTGTAEQPGGAQGYDESRNFSSFAGVFPANDPRYVIVVALDDTGAGETGGLVAAPVVARTLRRIAPMLGLRVEPASPAR